MATVSVVVRTFNEERHLSALLESLRTQAPVVPEIIVVDSGSFDRTCEIAEASADRLVSIDSADFTFGYSLNTGIGSASGAIVAIISAHARPTDRQWLQALTAPLSEPTTAMVYGRQLGAEASKFSEVQDFRRTYGTSPRWLAFPSFFANNANAAVRKDLWQQRSFDEALSGLEDIEWARYWMVRGYRVAYEPAAAVLHIHEETWPQVRRRYYREAVAARRLGLKHRWHAAPAMLREAAWCLDDLLRATRSGMLGTRSPEIVQFRLAKAAGTVRGLLDGSAQPMATFREAFLFDRTGKAVVIHGPGQASLDDVPVPAVKPGDVLIKVAYEGVCATDLEVLAGTLGYYTRGQATYPIIPGHEFSGRIAKVGANAGDLRPGDPVVVECVQSCGRCAQCQHANWIACERREEIGVIGRNGGYAEYVVTPARYVHRLPRDLDLRTACLCEPLAVVLKGLRRLGSMLGAATDRRCAVVGAGPIGHLCALALAAQGHAVTAFDRNPDRLSYFQGSAVRTAADPTHLADFDVVIEATGDPDALDVILQHSAPGSTMLLLGLPYAHREFSFESLVAYDRTVVGSVGSSAVDFDAAIGLVQQLPLDRFISARLPLDRYAEAWEQARERTHLKVLLEVDPTVSHS